MNIIGTGLTGLVGSRIVELLSPRYTFTNMSLDTGVDITDREAVWSRIESDTASTHVLHLAAYTNVQQAELDKPLGAESPAWKVNVEATQTIVDVCRKTGKKMIYIDTDYAFDGTKKTYTEEDIPHPLSWYAATKSEGAARVLTLGTDGIVVRISNPYRAHPVGKTDFVHKMLERLNQGLPIAAPTDQLFVPTFIDDLASVIDLLMTKNASGIYHAVGSTPISPFEAATIIAHAYKKDTSAIHETTFQEYFKNRAPTPQYAVLLDTKLKQYGITMHGFADGIRAVVDQESHSLSS